MSRFLALLLVVPMLIEAQSPSTKRWTVPRTPDNQPDLQGVWTNATLTPFERPREFADKAFFTPQEAAQFEKQARERNNGDRRDANPEADLATGYNDFWWDR